jgi:hypothetical protein
MYDVQLECKFGASKVKSESGLGSTSRRDPQLGTHPFVCSRGTSINTATGTGLDGPDALLVLIAISDLNEFQSWRDYNCDGPDPRVRLDSIRSSWTYPPNHIMMIYTYDTTSIS